MYFSSVMLRASRKMEPPSNSKPARKPSRAYRTPQHRRAVAKRVCSAVNLDVARGERIEFLEVAAPVRLDGGNAVLKQTDAAQVEVAGNAGSADRQPRILAPFWLCENAGDVVEHVLEGQIGRAHV